VRRSVRALTGVQERAERTLFGQAVISALIVIVLATGIIWCLPDSTIKSRLQPVVTPIAVGSGLDQYWGVFAPNPPRQVENIDVHVTLASGRDVVWSVPHGDPVIGQYSWYHWQKLKEHLVHEPGIRASFCRWVARQVAESGDSAVRVRMLMYAVTLPPPGSSVLARRSTTVLYDGTATGLR